MVDRDEATSRTIVEVSEYNGESSIRLCPTQLSAKYSERRKRQIVDEWVQFFESGPTSITSLYLVTRTPKRLFEALSQQSQLTTLQIKWGDYDDLRALDAMSELVRLRLRGASGVTTLDPLAALPSVQTLQIEGLRGLIDASPVGQMKSVTDLEIGGDWMTPRNVRITSAAFLSQLPQLRHLLLHALVVDDLDYRPLLALPNLKSVRVMATRGMTPPIEELIDRLPWGA